MNNKLYKALIAMFLISSCGGGGGGGSDTSGGTGGGGGYTPTPTATLSSSTGSVEVNTDFTSYLVFNKCNGLYRIRCLVRFYWYFWN